MTMLRNYRIFRLNVEYTTKDRQSDSLGELTGYSKPYRDSRDVTIVAPNAEFAIAAAKGYGIHEEIVTVLSEEAIDGFVINMPV